MIPFTDKTFTKNSVVLKVITSYFSCDILQMIFPFTISMGVRFFLLSKTVFSLHDIWSSSLRLEFQRFDCHLSYSSNESRKNVGPVLH